MRALALGHLAFTAGPSNAGNRIKAVNNVNASDMVSKIPISDVPGWLEAARLPKADAVEAAEKIIARVRLDCRK